MTTHATVARDATVRAKIPALAHLADGIGDPQVRNRGTIGGSIANNDPAADYPAGLVGLGATVHTSKRALSADHFFTGMFETALAEDEIVTAAAFPQPDTAAYVKFANPARSEEHTYELQSLMRISYAVFCLKQTKQN